MTFQVLSREEVQAKREMEAAVIESRPAGSAVAIAQQLMESVGTAPSSRHFVQPAPRHSRDSAAGLPVDERFIFDDDDEATS